MTYNETDSLKSLEACKDLVRECLREDEACRNNDLWLIISVWRKQGAKVYIDYKDMEWMHNTESIRRVRQHIQNTRGEFEPTDPVIKAKRYKHQKTIIRFLKNQ